MKNTVAILAFAFLPLVSHTQEEVNQLIAPGATLQQVSRQFKFTEGPAVDKKGDIFFTDQPNDKIWKYDTEGNLSLYLRLVF